jgi:hypothetical protein
MRTFTLMPSRGFGDDASEMHYRTAESQFHRCRTLAPPRIAAHAPALGVEAMSHDTARGVNCFRLCEGMTGVKVTRVDYIVNPPLVKNFEQKRLELAGHVDWEDTKPILAFVRAPFPFLLALGWLVRANSAAAWLYGAHQHGTSDDNITAICKYNFDFSKVPTRACLRNPCLTSGA